MQPVILRRENYRAGSSVIFKNYGNQIMSMNKILFLFLFSFSLNAGAQTIEKWKIADLENAIKNSKTPTVINFWATFCKPCLEELPYFQQLAKKYEKDGVKLILVSLDLPEA